MPNGRLAAGARNERLMRHHGAHSACRGHARGKPPPLWDYGYHHYRLYQKHYFSKQHFYPRSHHHESEYEFESLVGDNFEETRPDYSTSNRAYRYI